MQNVSRRSVLAGALATASIGAVAPPSAAVDSSAAEPISLGEPLKEINVVGCAITTTPDGVLTMYAVVSGEPAILVAVDARTREVLWVKDLPNAGGSYGLQVYPNGDLYISTYSAGRLYRLTYGADAVEDLGEPIPGETFLWDNTIGPDDRLYGVTYPGARLYAYDPASGAVQDYGALADDTKQGRTITSHNGKLYAGTMAFGHFLEIDPVTGAIREIALPPEAKPDDPLTSVFDIDASGDLIYVRVGTDIKYSPLYPYDLANDTWRAPIDQVAGLGVSQPGPSGEVYFMRNNTLHAYDPATETLTETPVEYPGRVYNFRGVAWVDLADPEWPGQTLTGFFWRGEVWRYNPETDAGEVVLSETPGTPIEILSLANAADGGVWAGGYLAGFSYVNPADGAVEFRRWSQTESINDDGENVWLGAYPDARGYRYDPDAPFNDPDYSPQPGVDVNPVKLWDFKGAEGDPQDRVFAIAREGRYMVAATGPKLTSFGGTLVVHNTRNDKVDTVYDIAPDRALTSLVARRGVVYAGSWINGGTGSVNPPRSEGTVLAYSLKHRDVLWQTSPVAGSPSYVGTTFDASGRLWTLAGTTLAEINPATGDTTLEITLPGTVDITGMTFPMLAGVVHPVPGADALLVKVAGRLSRVWTATGDVDDLGEFPYRLFVPLGDGQVVMSSDATLYRWQPPQPGGS